MQSNNYIIESNNQQQQQQSTASKHKTQKTYIYWIKRIMEQTHYLFILRMWE